MTVKLYGGYVGVTKYGDRIAVIWNGDNEHYPFEAPNGDRFSFEGKSWSGGHDIVGLWSDRVIVPADTGAVEFMHELQKEMGK